MNHKNVNSGVLYNTLENQYWLEPTDKENLTQNMKWLFYQPVNNLDGLFMLEYFERGYPKKESGKFSIEMINGQAIIKIKTAEFRIDFEDNEDVMLWHSIETPGSTRVLKRLKTP